MKIRITPLNLIAAFALAVFVANLFGANLMSTNKVATGLSQVILMCLILVTFITDLIFRFTFKTIKRIWLIEILFVITAIILMLILQNFIR